jgi:hypothetical protein
MRIIVQSRPPAAKSAGRKDFRFESSRLRKSPRSLRILELDDAADSGRGAALFAAAAALERRDKWWLPDPAR